MTAKHGPTTWQSKGKFSTKSYRTVGTGRLCPLVTSQALSPTEPFIFDTIVSKESPKSKKKPVEATWLSIPLQHLGILAGIVGTVLYLQTIAFDYTQDDSIVILDNMYTVKGFDGIAGLFSHDTFYGYFKDESKLRLVSGGRYRPLTPAMFAIEYAIAGPKPWLSHLINAISYGLLCWILFGFTRALLSARLNSTTATHAAAIAALLFAVHPIHTEAVANIKGRDEIVAAMGAILGLWLMIRSLKEEKSNPLPLGAFAAFFLGMLAKENVITMLAVVPITMLWHGKTAKVNWLQNMWPILLASVLFIVIRGAITGLDPGDPPKELMNNPFLKVEGKFYVPFTVAEKTATITYIMGKYVQLLFVPYPLTHDYYPREIEIQHWGKPLVWASLIFWLAALYAVIKGWKPRTWLAFGIIFYCATMSITSNIVFPVGTNMSERFAFLPSIGFVIPIGVLLARWMEAGKKKQVTSALLAVLIILGGWTLLRSRVWLDNNTLFSSDIRPNTRSAKLLNAAGGNLLTQSEHEQDPDKRKRMMIEAQGYLNRALEIHPNYKLSYLLLGNSYFHLGDYEKAIQHFRHVLSLDPNYEEGRRNLGVALRDYGKFQGEKNNNLAMAVSMLEEAVTYLPNDFETYHLLGVAYGHKGDPVRAVEYFKKEVELAPKNASGYFNLGVAYRQMGDMENAQKSFDTARALDPDLPQFKKQQQQQQQQ